MLLGGSSRRSDGGRRTDGSLGGLDNGEMVLAGGGGRCSTGLGGRGRSGSVCKGRKGCSLQADAR